MNIHYLERSALQERISCAIQPASVILDIGCGIRPQTLVTPQLHICCEPHAEYIAFLQRVYGHDPSFLIFQADALQFLSLLPRQSLDSVFLVDVIEHLPKEAGYFLLQECERVARRQIVLFTPLGFLCQEYEYAEEDAWGFHGGQWQRHLSGWTPEDFDSSWIILACRDFHSANGKGERLDPPAGAFWGIKSMAPPAEFCPPTDRSSVSRHLREQLANALLEIQKRQNQLAHQRSQLADRDASLAAQASEICKLRHATHTLQMSIDGMHNSLAWRFAALLSRLGHSWLAPRLQGVGRSLGRRIL